MADIKHRDDIQLAAGQNAFELSDGTLVAIGFTQQDVPVNPHNLVSDEHVAIKVRGWKIDAEGVAVDGHEMPAKVYTIPHAAIAEGTVVLENDLTQMSLDALVRIEQWLKMKVVITKMIPRQQEA